MGMELLHLVEHPSVMMGMELLHLVEHPSVMMGMELLHLVEHPSVMMDMELLCLGDPPSVMMNMVRLYLEWHPLIMMDMELLCLAFYRLTAMPRRAVNQGREKGVVITVLRLIHSSLSSLGSLLPVAQRRAEEAFNTVKEAGAAVMSLFPLGPRQQRRHKHGEYGDWRPITSPYDIPHHLV